MNPAGPAWCAKFQTSTSLDDLIEPFRGNCERFIAEIKSAGGKVDISATYRPSERAYLMHYAGLIVWSKQDPALIPPMEGVDIQWDLGTPEATHAAAGAMVTAYGIKYPAALASRHTQRLAIDCTISGFHLTGQALWDMGKSFGVIKLVSDPPHWSRDGH